MTHDHHPWFFIDYRELDMHAKFDLHFVRTYLNEVQDHMSHCLKKDKSTIKHIISKSEELYKLCEGAILHEHGRLHTDDREESCSDI